MIGYELDKTGPAPLTWDDYVGASRTEWQPLLSPTNKDEGLIHAFLERNPCWVPGALSMGRPSGHYPWGLVLVSKPQLPGGFVREPDFMWLASDSGTLYPVLIEIETPAKKWFTDKYEDTPDLRHAMSQLREWRTWMSNHANVTQFCSYYAIEAEFLRFRRLRPQYVLVHGSRQEFSDRPEKIPRKASLEDDPETTVMTFDRLEPAKLDSLVTATVGPHGVLTAKHIMPTTRYGPTVAREWCSIRGKDAAIDRCVLMSAERRAFLKKRLPYWDEWGRQRGGYRIDPDGWE